MQQELRHIYGSSYFGSGGASGRLYCSKNCRPAGSKDNGFVSGPEAVDVIDPAQAARACAYGSDSIGGGRSWHEAYEWIPELQAWRPALFDAYRASKEEIRDWLT